MTTRGKGITWPRFIQSGVAAAVRSALLKLLEDKISVEDFRDLGDTDLQAFTKWKAACLLQVGPDAGAGFKYGITGYIPAKTYNLNTADFIMPNCNILCEGYINTGTFKLIFNFPKRIRVDGLGADHIKLSGAFFCSFTRLLSPDLYIDGGGYAIGTFWNEFSGVMDTTIDLTNWSVNQNMFTNGRGRIKTQGTGSNLGEGHMNNAVHWDSSCAFGGDSGIFNISSGLFDAGGYFKPIPQDSVHFGVYAEDEDGAGSGIVKLDGPQHFFGLNADAAQIPHVTKRHHILGTVNIAERLGDFFAGDGENQLPSGNWSTLVLDDQGNECPPDIFINPRQAGMTSVDLTEPFGIGRSYGCNQTVAFAKAFFNVLPNASTEFCFIAAYKSINDTPFQFSTTVNRGGGDVTFYETAGVPAGSGSPHWYLIRIAGKGNGIGGATTTIEFTITTAGPPSANDIRFGGFLLTRSKTAFQPGPQDIIQYAGNVLRVKNRYIQHGEVAVGTSGTPIATPPSADVAFVFEKAFSAVPIITSLTVRENGTTGNNWTKVAVKTGTLTINGFTARLTYATNFAGFVAYEAKGPL